ncbi:hormogonium polysaccharide secretion pseudopilin HpsC [Microcoleus sp. AT9b-C3]|uniref:hormogonium polysaccharide secretion pseudopilin HpsC n=1 Tax=Microcoleus sp. AT9b-C3 TaxID=2818629 RepID=UPI002FD3F619
MKTLLRLLLKTHHQRNRSGPDQTDKGMTLVELLVGAIMAFIIITPMLGFVVDMLNTDRREQVKSNTEQDLQAAVDFIAQDLSQAIYIYDQAGITATTAKLPPPPTNTTGTPVLVFWKRQQIKNAVPINSANAKKPSDCPPNGSECNDTYVLSLVVYYQIRDTTPNPTWCQPSGGTCPTRIARYEIRDGVKNPNSSDPTNPYYSLTDANEYAPDAAFEPTFDISKPLVNVTKGTGFTKDAEVLVNYIDHSPLTGIPINLAECQTALGNPKDTTGVTPTDIPETTLRIPPAPPDIVKSFYACVDTSKNIARVTLRGNSLRRIQTDANYDPNKSAFFPTASVQVQGLGARGQ